MTSSPLLQHPLDVAGEAASLAHAVHEAVDCTVDLLTQLQSRLMSLIQQAEEDAGALPELDGLRLELEESFSRHLEDSSTFRIVLFGRTGVGKSTFIETFTGGDGTSISSGESDFTTEPRRVAWGPLELVDTPGYGGWGRTRTRQELEAEASSMVARADLVVLCFDDQNQQESEFLVVRDQIERFGRPCVAVLNVRNARWRENQLGPMAAATFEQQVAVHARHIRDELQRLGLPAVPVVAVHMQRAAAAMADDDYLGHDAELVRTRRERFTREQLAEMSNVHRLEMLLRRCLIDGAPKLRLQAVENDLLARVRHAAERLDVAAKDAARDVDVAMSALCSALEVLGSGQASAGVKRGRWLHDDVIGAEALLDLAALRPELLKGVSAGGRLQQTAHELLAIHLSPHRRKLREASEAIAHRAIGSQRLVNGDALAHEMQPHVDEAQKAAASALEGLAEEFADQLAGLALHLQVEGARIKATSVDGRSGRDKVRLLQATEILTQAGTALTVVLAATGPVGWLAAAGGAAASWLVGRWRRRASRQAEAKGAKARADALSAVRRAADDVYTALEQHYWDSVTQAATGAATALLGGVASGAVVQARREAALISAAISLGASQAETERTDADAVITAAVRAVRAAQGAPGRHDPLLGQSQNPGADLAAQEDLQQQEHDELARELRRRADNWLAYRHDPSSHPDEEGPYRIGIITTNATYGAAAARYLESYAPGLCVSMVPAELDTVASHELLLWLLAPNIDLHTLPAAHALLATDSPYRHPVFARSVFCIAGLDQLGPDLLNESAAVPIVLARKAQELSNYLATFGLDASPDTVLFLAPSPYGLEPTDLPVDTALFGLPQLADLLSTQPPTWWARQWHQQVHLAVRQLNEGRQLSAAARARLHGIDQVIAACEASVAARRRLLQESEATLRSALTDRVDAMALRVCEAESADTMNSALAQLNAWPSDAVVVEALETWHKEFISRYEKAAEEHASEISDLLRQQLRATRIGGRAAGDATGLGKLLATTSRLASQAGQSRDAWYNLVKTVSRGSYKFKPWGAIKGAGAAKALGARLAAIGIVITLAEQYFDRRAVRQRNELKEQILTEARKTVDAALLDYLRHEPREDDGSVGLFVPAEREIDALAGSVLELRAERAEVASEVDALAGQEADAAERLQEHRG